MAKLTTNDLASVVPPTAAATAINNNFALVETAMENTLSRDGTSPNQMGANLDMNSNRIINLPEATSNTEPVRKAEFDEALEYFSSLERPINVLHYYLEGTHADHTIAIDAAFAASKASLTYDATRVVDRAARQRPVYFPPGDYTYSGAGVSFSGSECYVLAYSDAPQAAKIKITSSVYLITHDNIVLGTYIKNLHIIGGKGVTRYTRTAENVTSFHVYEDNIFDNYTAAAITNESSDMPYWHIMRNYFYGTESGGSYGIAIGGYLDSSRIMYNSFCNNKYHIKIGWQWSGTVDIQFNDFIQFVASIRTADIWLVPSTTANAVNSGFGSNIRHNKFGNENLGVADIRILIAAEGAGSGRDTKVASTTWYTTGQYLSGLTIDDNRFSGVANGVAPLIKCYIEHLDNFVWGPRNNFDGGTHSYLLEYQGTFGESEAYLTRNNCFYISPTLYMTKPFTADVCNKGVGVVNDPFGLYANSENTLLYGISDDVGFLNIANGRYSDLTVYGGASKSAVTDVYGGTETAEVTFATANDSSGIYTACATPVDDVLSWVEFDVGAAAADSVFYVSLAIRNFTTGATALLRTNLLVPATQKTVRIPFFFPPSATPSGWAAVVYSTDYNSGAARTKANVGRLRVYQSRAPMNGGHIRTTADGQWNTGHIVMGGYHLWIDGTGDLRIKFGAPTSDTDGTVVGTQT